MKTQKAIYLFLLVLPIFALAIMVSGCEKKSTPGGGSTPPLTAQSDTFSSTTDSMVFQFKTGTKASEYKLKVLPTGTEYTDADLPVQVSYLSSSNQFVVTTQSSSFSTLTTFCLKDTAGCPDTMNLSSFKMHTYPPGGSGNSKFGGVGVVDLRGGLKHTYIWDLDNCSISIYWSDATLQIGRSSDACFSIESSGNE
jgi:hypothetical protein